MIAKWYPVQFKETYVWFSVSEGVLELHLMGKRDKNVGKLWETQLKKQQKKTLIRKERSEHFMSGLVDNSLPPVFVL